MKCLVSVYLGASSRAAGKGGEQENCDARENFLAASMRKKSPKHADNSALNAE